MHIGIDARLSGLRHAGIGRYTQNLIRELLQTATEKDRFTVFFHDEDQAKEVLGTEYESKQVQIALAPIQHYSLKEQLQLPRLFSKQKLDILHVPHFNVPVAYRGKMIVTIHDLLWHEHRGAQVTTLHPLLYFLKYLFYRFITYWAVSKAVHILVPAQTVKDTVLRYYPFAQDKITVTYEGTSIPATAKTTVKKRNKTLLYVGSLYPHKNVQLVLAALTELPEYTLLIASARSVFQEKMKQRVKKLDLQDRVSFLGFVPDEELALLYQEVTAVVQPSFSEGFGLTGIEAMSLGTPVLASDIPIFSEVYEDAAVFFSPYSVSSFLYAVHRLETLDLSEKIDTGLALSKRYNWKQMAKKTYAAYCDSLR